MAAIRGMTLLAPAPLLLAVLTWLDTRGGGCGGVPVSPFSGCLVDIVLSGCSRFSRCFVGNVWFTCQDYLGAAAAVLVGTAVATGITGGRVQFCSTLSLRQLLPGFLH